MTNSRDLDHLVLRAVDSLGRSWAAGNLSQVHREVHRHDPFPSRQRVAAMLQALRRDHLVRDHGTGNAYRWRLTAAGREALAATTADQEGTR